MLYEHLADMLYDAPGDWNLKVCPKPECGLVWLDPIPLEDEIGKAYTTYYTHAAEWTNTGGTWLSKLLRKGLATLDPLRRQRRRLFLMFVGDLKPGKLLDVGCGNGTRLAQLESLGWNVYGQDLDSQAVRYAQETFGLKVHLGRLEDIRFPEQFFDCITLNHVIEHVHDPIGLLKECRRILRTGGLMVLVTPNSKSFAHTHYGRFWFGLDPPRHLHLFSPKTLSEAAARAGFTVSCASTTAANGEIFEYGSLNIRDGNTIPSKLRHRIVRRIRMRGFYYRLIIEHLRDADSGEECVLQATSPV
jgi:SAM-dependent methyltransferase